MKCENTLEITCRHVSRHGHKATDWQQQSKHYCSPRWRHRGKQTAQIGETPGMGNTEGKIIRLLMDERNDDKLVKLLQKICLMNVLLQWVIM